MRLHVFLSRAGVASRRQSEQLILRGKVKVNNRIVTRMGVQVDPNKDVIFYNNHEVILGDQNIVLVFYKPRGVISTMKRGKEEGKILSDVIKCEERLFPVGRLDRESEGLILLTNNGDLAQKLSHPRYEHEKEYAVTVDKTVTDQQLDRLRKPFRLGGYVTHSAQVDKKSDKELKIILHEGRKHQIRNMCSRVGLQVRKLRRVRIQNIELGNLKPGTWRQIPLEAIS